MKDSYCKSDQSESLFERNLSEAAGTFFAHFGKKISRQDNVAHGRFLPRVAVWLWRAAAMQQVPPEYIQEIRKRFHAVADKIGLLGR